MSISLGTVIKKLREKNGLTQKQLAEGICSPRHLSRIEQNISEMNIYFLCEFSFRLGENLLEYFPYIGLENPFHWKKIIDELETWYFQEQYAKIQEKAKDLMGQCPNNHVAIKQRIYWYFKMSACYCQTANAYSTQDFLDLLRLTMPFQKTEELWKTNLKPFEVRILNSVIFTYLQSEDYDTAEEWMLKAIEMFERLHFEVKDISYINIFYNLSRLYFLQKKYKEAFIIAERGISLCKHNNVLFGIESLFNIKGKALYYLEEKEKALLYFNGCLQLNSILYDDDLKHLSINSNLNKNYQIADLGYLH